MSKLIDISNYEAYVMDYLENKLEPEVHKSFQAFLILHPEIEHELEELASSKLEVRPPSIKMDSSALKIQVTSVGSITAENYEMAFALEPGSNKVDSFLESNPLLAKEARQYAAAQLSVDASITYPAKKELKRPVPIWGIESSNTWRAAAAFALLLGIVGLLPNSDVNDYTPRDLPSSFASIDIPEGNRGIKEELPSAEPKMAASVFRTSLEKPLDLAPIAGLPESWESPTIPYRDEPMMAAIMPQVMEQAESDKTAQRTPELSVAQFIGKEVFNVSPAKAQTTRALLTEGAKQVIERNDQFAFDSKQVSDERKVFRLMAGALEFKRVTYTASN